MNYRGYMRKVEERLGDVRAADRIQEDLWFDVVIRELNELSKRCAEELQKETGIIWDKGTYQLMLPEAPPTRLLALAIVIVPWLAWVMCEKHGEDGLLSARDCWVRMEEAYRYGVELSKAGEIP